MSIEKGGISMSVATAPARGTSLGKAAGGLRTAPHVSFASSFERGSNFAPSLAGSGKNDNGKVFSLVKSPVVPFTKEFSPKFAATKPGEKARDYMRLVDTRSRADGKNEEPASHVSQERKAKAPVASSVFSKPPETSLIVKERNTAYASDRPVSPSPTRNVARTAPEAPFQVTVQRAGNRFEARVIAPAPEQPSAKEQQYGKFQRETVQAKSLKPEAAPVPAEPVKGVEKTQPEPQSVQSEQAPVPQVKAAEGQKITAPSQEQRLQDVRQAIAQLKVQTIPTDPIIFAPTADSPVKPAEVSPQTAPAEPETISRKPTYLEMLQRKEAQKKLYGDVKTPSITVPSQPTRQLRLDWSQPTDSTKVSAPVDAERNVASHRQVNPDSRTIRNDKHGRLEISSPTSNPALVLPNVEQLTSDAGEVQQQRVLKEHYDLTQSATKAQASFSQEDLLFQSDAKRRVEQTDAQAIKTEQQEAFKAYVERFVLVTPPQTIKRPEAPMMPERRPSLSPQPRPDKKVNQQEEDYRSLLQEFEADFKEALKLKKMYKSMGLSEEQALEKSLEVFHNKLNHRGIFGPLRQLMIRQYGDLLPPITDEDPAVLRLVGLMDNQAAQMKKEEQEDKKEQELQQPEGEQEKKVEKKLTKDEKETEKDKDNKSRFIIDHKTSKVWEYEGLSAVDETFSKAEQRRTNGEAVTVTGNDLAKKMPYEQYLELKSTLLKKVYAEVQHLDDGAYEEFLKNLSKAGTIYSRKEAEETVEDYIKVTPPVDMVDQNTPGDPVEYKDVYRVLKNRSTVLPKAA